MIDTWKCHVCRRDRPDAQISVHSTTTYIGDVPIKQNVRYCNDNPVCINGAKHVDFMRHTVMETNKPVEGSKPELTTRFYWRAERRCRALNEKNTSDFYRYEVRPSIVHGKWEVIAMQNVAMS